MTDSEPRSIGDSLAFVTRNLGIARPKDAAALVGAWPELVGAALAAHSQPAHLRNGTLTIEVEDGAWGAPLTYLGDTLITRANEVLGAELVTTIRVVVRGGGGGIRAGGQTPPIRPVSSGE
jgi:hypothetical protein